MSEDREIWKSAQEMIDRYGQDALSQINTRIAELEGLGETEALSVWKRIRGATEALAARPEPRVAALIRILQHEDQSNL